MVFIKKVKGTLNTWIERKGKKYRLFHRSKYKDSNFPITKWMNKESLKNYIKEGY